MLEMHSRQDKIRFLADEDAPEWNNGASHSEQRDRVLHENRYGGLQFV
jgi:hypothetical protein